jgi:ribosome hibernation promoting factor
MSHKSKAEEFVNDTYDINILGRNVLVTDAMKDYAIEKVSKIDKFSHRIIDVQITMDIQKLEHRVDITMKVDHVKIKSSSSSEDMYASIDLASDKLQQRLVKYKKRLQEHAAKPLSSIDMNVNVVNANQDEVAVINDEIESENQRQLLNVYHPHKVLSQETRPLKILTTTEAIMKIDLSGDNFLIFRSEEDQMLKVIYRRTDGHLGIIETKN